jgi:hypothetical protein
LAPKEPDRSSKSPDGTIPEIKSLYLGAICDFDVEVLKAIVSVKIETLEKDLVARAFCPNVRRLAYTAQYMMNRSGRVVDKPETEPIKRGGLQMWFP